MFGIKPSIQCLCFALWDNHNSLLHPQAGSVGTILDHSESYINYITPRRLEGSVERHSQFVTEMEVVLYMCLLTGWTPFMLCVGTLFPLIYTSCL